MQRLNSLSDMQSAEQASLWGGRRFSLAYQTPRLWSAFCRSTTCAYRSSSNRTEQARATRIENNVESQRNKGNKNRAAGAVLQYLFYAIGIDAAEAAYLEPNIGSGRVMQKIGMREVPYTESKHYQLKGETEADGYRLIFYKITKEEYASLSCKAE